MGAESSDILGTEPHWLFERRKQAAALYSALKMPAEKDSPTGKYTALNEIPTITEKYPENAASIELSGLSEEEKQQGVIFLDFKEALRKAPHLLQTHFMSTLIMPQRHKLAALHCSKAKSGVVIYIPDGVHVKGTLSAKISSPHNLSKSFTHTLLILGRDSKLAYFEEFGENIVREPSYHSDLCEIFLSENAKLDYHCLQDYDLGVTDYAHREARLEAGAELNWHIGLFGGATSVNTVDTLLAGQGSRVGNFGGFFGREMQHSDISADAYHLVPGTKNQILWHGVNTGKSTSVFRGMIEIEKEAIQAETTMNQYTLLLSKEAKSNTIPSLAIKTNDVIAKHGTSVGQINEEHIFYLMSRGLSLEEARRQIVEGFFEPFLGGIADPSIRERMAERVNRYMAEERGVGI